MVAGSSDRLTRALMTAVLGMTLNVHSYNPVSVPRRSALSGLCCGAREEAADLLVPELDQIPVVSNNLVPVAPRALEELRQRKPLAGHLVPVVGIHELIVVHTVGRVALDALHGGLHLVQRDDVVDERLARRRQAQRLGRVGLVVARLVRLAHLEVLAGQRGVGREVDLARVVGLLEGRRGGGHCSGGGGGFEGVLEGWCEAWSWSGGWCS